jgi:benzodiazapine receptor
LRNLLGLVGWLGITFAAALAGSRFMPGEWYASLVKPSWNPPNWIFGPVWSVLYLLMALSAWLVWKEAGFAGAGAALSLFIFQLVLNGLWSYLFFGLHRPNVAFLDIVALWMSILTVALMFFQVNRTAGYLLLPYLAWVGFAAILNFVLWRLNAS